MRKTLKERNSYGEGLPFPRGARRERERLNGVWMNGRLRRLAEHGQKHSSDLPPPVGKATSPGPGGRKDEGQGPPSLDNGASRLQSRLIPLFSDHLP
ncbi:hypothetical protein TNCV_3975301 [Trichonephila clavipes]|nr:hypothetical protein TNCV_3975301 [Trichonephila clavipes]